MYSIYRRILPEFGLMRMIDILSEVCKGVDH